MSLPTSAIGPLVNGAASVSLHAWVYVASTTTGAFDNSILQTVLNGTASAFVLSINKAGANRVVGVTGLSVTGDSLQTKLSTSDLALNTWHSVGGVMDFAGDTITPYANGVAEGGGAVTFANAAYTHGTPSTADRIGSKTGAVTTASQVDGRIGHLAIWTGTLSANAFAALARGALPLRIGSSSGAGPVFYMPIWGLDSPEYCLVCGATGTITGSLPQANDAPVRPFTRMERASLPDIPDTFQAAWARGANRLVGGGVWTGG